ncbi:MAG: response regulator [Elusimicrobia bacterium]|nr:response regulator [Elusimicrobiota bacterium]
MPTTLRILIVDDSPAERMILRDILEGFGHAVVAEAESEAPALAAYAHHKPDLVTLDLSLAEGDGVTVLKALRAADPAAKALIISGNSQKKVVEMVLAAGAKGFLEKPYSPEELSSAVASAAS